MTEQIEKTVKLHLGQRQKRVLLINDTYPGILTVIAGIGMIQGGHSRLLGAVSILAGLTLVAFGVKEWRSTPGEGHHGIHWFDVFGGMVTIVDALVMYKPTKGFQPATLYIFAGLVIIAKGVFASKLPGMRRLTITKDGFKIRTSPFRVLKMSWDDIVVLTVDKSKVSVTTKENNTRGISLRRVANSSEAAAELINSGRERGINVIEGAIKDSDTFWIPAKNPRG